MLGVLVVPVEQQRMEFAGKIAGVFSTRLDHQIN